MTNPWLGIPLSDYESHMALPGVAQASLLSDVFESLLQTHRPRSVAVVGCAGGNGFDRIDPAVTTRVIGVDINASYLDVLRERHGSRFSHLELISGDIAGGEVRFEPVDLIYAALVLEYVDVRRAMKSMASLLTSNGVLATVTQCPGSKTVTPSPFTSLEQLAPVMRLVEHDELAIAAFMANLNDVVEHRRMRTPAGKEFDLSVLRRRRGLVHVRPAAAADCDAMLDVWLRSVRATHDFLSADEIDSMIPQVRAYLVAVTPATSVLCAASGDVVGFMGMDGNHIDSLFLAPEYFGRGHGRWLVQCALMEHGELTVEVNEENTGAVRFYEKCGFVVEGHSELDTAGRPHPLLHMRLVGRK